MWPVTVVKNCCLSFWLCSAITIIFTCYVPTIWVSTTTIMLSKLLVLI